MKTVDFKKTLFYIYLFCHAGRRFSKKILKMSFCPKDARLFFSKAKKQSLHFYTGKKRLNQAAISKY